MTTFDTNYVADTDPLLKNPERGMYFGKPPDPGPQGTPENFHTICPKWLWLESVCHEDLVWNGYNKSGTSPVLNDYAEEELEKARNDGYKILFRPRYDKEPGGGIASDDCMINGANVFHADTMVRQKNHIDAVAAMLGDYKDVIAYIQAGYLGNWGEWNTAGKDEDGNPYTPANAPLLYSRTDRSDIIHYLLAAYKAKNIMQHVELRRPVFVKEAVEDPRNTSAKVGLHNDCFMSSDSDSGSDSGTYSDFFDFSGGSPQNFGSTTSARKWAKDWTENFSFGGETCPSEAHPGNERWRSCSNMTGATSEPASLHMNYLNGDYADDAVKTWKEGDLQGDVCYDDIRRNLGYRFHVMRVEYTPTVSAGGTFSVAVDVENSGWARLHKPRDAKLVLRNGTRPLPKEPEEYTFSGGPVSNWAPGTTTTISVSEPAPAPGTYSVRLWIPDLDLIDLIKKIQISGQPEVYPRARTNYAVKLATKRNSANVFDPNTRDNNLGVSITVQ
jgi:hypothetical protein